METALALAEGEIISCLTLHQLDQTCVKRAHYFLERHGGRWSELPLATGARFFLEFPPGTRIFLGRGYQNPDELRYDIILPDGASLQAFSKRIAGQERRYNTIVLPPRWPFVLLTPPGQPLCERIISISTRSNVFR